MTHFKIIVPMYNCSRFVTDCLDSVLKQGYDDWQMVVLVEPSDDDTFSVTHSYLSQHNNGKIILARNPVRQYVPKNHIEGVRLCSPAANDVIVLLDGDDRLYDGQVLSYLASVYADESVWVTWGSYVFAHDLKKKGGASRPYPEHQGLREWRYSHLKTFRYFLLQGIKDTDLRDTKTGNYYQVAGDMALMFPMVEMAGRTHGRFIDQPLYVYNQSTLYNDEKIHAKEVRRCHIEIHNRSRYSERTKEELCRAK
jgi:glycosyltransferase involved in cell wall biosynthesis